MENECQYRLHPVMDAGVSAEVFAGFERIGNKVAEDGIRDSILVCESYPGIPEDSIIDGLSFLCPSLVIRTSSLLKDQEWLDECFRDYVTDDRVFGFMCHKDARSVFDEEKLAQARDAAESSSGLVLIAGPGSSLVTEKGTLLYFDITRWEIQLRYRKGMPNWLFANADEETLRKVKRGYFIEWRIADRHKVSLADRIVWYISADDCKMPKMVRFDAMRKAVYELSGRPFRMEPYFDPGVWGGQWMKEVCGLDKSRANFGWCFDCVPEENSLYLKVTGELFELPANDLVFYQTRALLGGPVEARFGQDFPIRFDFLDTMGGGNLSLQVHPVTQYIRDTFGMNYTQDESYYLLDAEEGASVFLGLKTGVDPEAMLAALNEARRGGEPFDAEKYVNRWPAKRHDHFLIPAGTVHCSGAGAMVLEISATPSIFTFKLWDWGRLGLDGKPRPINIGHGSKVIQWERQTEFTRHYLINQVEMIAEGDGWREERTGLHENEFIETRRHWFTDVVPHDTDGGVQVLNVIKGDELIVESPVGAFEPFIVHYAETFIVPACVGAYTIRPYGSSVGKYCGTIKAYVRFRQ